MILGARVLLGRPRRMLVIILGFSVLRGFVPVLGMCWLLVRVRVRYGMWRLRLRLL